VIVFKFQVWQVFFAKFGECRYTTYKGLSSSGGSILKNISPSMMIIDPVHSSTGIENRTASFDFIRTVSSNEESPLFKNRQS
jgi:hypothetical protein